MNVVSCQDSQLGSCFSKTTVTLRLSTCMRWQYTVRAARVPTPKRALILLQFYPVEVDLDGIMLDGERLFKL